MELLSSQKKAHCYVNMHYMVINWVSDEKRTEQKLTEGQLVILLSQTVYYCTLFKGKLHANVLSDTAHLFVIQMRRHHYCQLPSLTEVICAWLTDETRREIYPSCRAARHTSRLNR